MPYEHKTTVVIIYTEWDESRAMNPRAVCEDQIHLATLVADLCQMDIMSISHSPGGASEHVAICVYFNNGMTPDAIVAALQPNARIKSPPVWQVIDVFQEQGAIKIYQVMNEEAWRELDNMRRA